VVQGGLTTGLLHALVAMDLPGSGTVFLSQHWRFTAPVFIGDTVTVTYRIAERDIAARKAFSQVTVTNQRGEVVAAAVHILKVVEG
jgi:3-hydroxybutyryl-CoA dehydratase